jgi:hypothetical protein
MNISSGSAVRGVQRGGVSMVDSGVLGVQIDPVDMSKTVVNAWSRNGEFEVSLGSAVVLNFRSLSAGVQIKWEIIEYA